MNVEPATHIRVAWRELQAFVSAAGQAAGLPPPRADFLAELLVSCDLRGVFSHGTRLMAQYVPLLRGGKLNCDPGVRVVQETPVSLLVDGDGGLGYFAAHEGTRLAIEKAKQHGVAVLSTRNHGHIGAAGIYSRMTLEHDLLCFVTSASEHRAPAGSDYVHAAGGPPMSFSAPTEEEDPLVLDFATTYFFRSGHPLAAEIALRAPHLLFTHIGLGAIGQSWAGLLSGLSAGSGASQRAYPAAHSAALAITFKIDLFIAPAQFKREMDEYVRMVRSLKPAPGFEQASLPGGIELAREGEYRQDGIPLGPLHQQALEGLARELQLVVPW